MPAPPAARRELTSGSGRPRRLGPFLCWAVVFADIGTSVYYTPGILHRQVGAHAALFVSMTLVVFVLLSVKYAEVATRYPEGGGVVTVATSALNPTAGLLGGLLILVDYFLTAALSALSGVLYLSVVAPGLDPIAVPATVAALILLGALNVMGVRSSATVSALFATAAAAGQLAVVIAVTISLGPAGVLASLPRVLNGPRLVPLGVLTGYAGAFLAFSGLESIAQLAPSMAEPRRRVAAMGMVLVVLTVAVTSPLLTLWSTTLLDPNHADPDQLVSLLGGHAAGLWLQDGVAVTGALLLVFASNTAIIGSYHVFLALSKMRFLPAALQQVNRWRGTPHWSVAVAVGIPVGVVVLSRGDVGLLGDLYAFGLLGAFSLTCISLDIVRWHERHEPAPRASSHVRPAGRVMLAVGVVTTVLVTGAWLTNLVAKPLATLFGGIVLVVGAAIAFATNRAGARRGEPVVFPYLHRPHHPMVLVHQGRRMAPAAVLAALPEALDEVPAVVEAAAEAGGGRPVAFVYLGQPAAPPGPPRLLEVLDPYLEDPTAHRVFSRAEREARRLGMRARYVYVPQTSAPKVLDWIVKALNPEATVAIEGTVPGEGEGER